MDHFITNFNSTSSWTVPPEDLITFDELQGIITKLRPFKAPGEDGIHNVLIKQLPDPAIHHLCSLFNECLKLGHWPNIYKSAKVIPIPKAGKDHKYIENYRPISLLDAVGKIFEKTVLNRISSFSASHNIIKDEQFGFKHGHSTIHQVKRIVNSIKTNKATRKSSGMLIFDVEKAFDSVWHQGLLYKLHLFGFPLFTCKIIASFITNRSFRVFVNNCASGPQKIPAGLPQGSLIAPTLYSIFTADMTTPKNTTAALYADDTAIITAANRTNTIITRLQHSASHLNSYFEKWKIKINALKTQAIVFPYNKSRKRLPRSNVILNNDSINFSTSATYLGVKIDSNLNFRAHIEQTNTKALRCFRALYPILAPKSKMSTKNKLIIYKTIIRPIITYGSSVWMNAAKTHLKALQVTQNKCLKTILRLPWRYPTSLLHNHANLPTLENLFSEINTNFLEKCSTSQYGLIRAIAE